MNKLILYVCAWICLHSCGFSKSQEESMLEYALSQAGDNRKELDRRCRSHCRKAALRHSYCYYCCYYCCYCCYPSSASAVSLGACPSPSSSRFLIWPEKLLRAGTCGAHRHRPGIARPLRRGANPSGRRRDPSVPGLPAKWIQSLQNIGHPAQTVKFI